MWGKMGIGSLIILILSGKKIGNIMWRNGRIKRQMRNDLHSNFIIANNFSTKEYIFLEISKANTSLGPRRVVDPRSHPLQRHPLRLPKAPV